MAGNSCPSPLPTGVQCVVNGGGQDITTTFTPSCMTVTNNHPSGEAIMVPVQSQTGWTDFLTKLPPGVTATTCTPTTCAAVTIGNCNMGLVNDGVNGTGTCSVGYTGSCSYHCKKGFFSHVSDTCTLIIASTCAATTIGNCILTLANDGATETGTCSATSTGAATGACSYQCASGQFSPVSDTCSTSPSSTTVDCNSNGYWPPFSGNKYQACTVNGTISSVVLVQQYSSDSCTYNSSWGWRLNYVWVQKGCRAQFQVNF